jgi:hypothetical protein
LPTSLYYLQPFYNMSGWWDDFANNLATDLTALIVLFGETPTKQYLSECVSLLDLIIFSVAPLGVITTLVSVIRVCGASSLRAFIGRAQEGAALAEAELCSSTSRDVCELYNNGGIARVLGRPSILEFVHDQHVGKDDFLHDAAGIYTFEEYIGRGQTEWTISSKSSAVPPPGHRPNLTLNIGITVYPFWVQMTAAMAGVSAQLGISVWAGIARYSLGWTRGDIQDRYAVPVLLIGSTLLSLGIFMCAFFIERITKEVIYSRSLDTNARSRVCWVQPGTQFIGDQAFDSFIFSHPQNCCTRHIASWKRRSQPQTLRVFTAVGTAATGFVLQFLGLRACHSSVAVAQLGLILLMSVLRSSLNSSRLNQGDVYPKDESETYQGCELDWLALRLGHLDSPMCPRGWEVCNSRYHPPTEFLTTRFDNTRIYQMTLRNNKTCIISGFRLDLPVTATLYPWGWTVPSSINNWRFQHLISHEQEGTDKMVMYDVGAVLLQRARLGFLTSDWGGQLVKSRSAARSLRAALESTINILFSGNSVLEDGWGSSFRIYCAVPCQISENAGVLSDSNGQSLISYYVSSSRSNREGLSSTAWSIDDFTNRDYVRGADSCELEAILGL